MSSYQKLQEEKNKQNDLPREKSYKFNDGYLKYINPCSLFRAADSETAFCVEKTEAITKVTPTQSAHVEQSTRSFAYSAEDLDTDSLTPPMSPR